MFTISVSDSDSGCNLPVAPALTANQLFVVRLPFSVCHKQMSQEIFVLLVHPLTECGSDRVGLIRAIPIWRVAIPEQ